MAATKLTGTLSKKEGSPSKSRAVSIALTLTLLRMAQRDTAYEAMLPKRRLQPDGFAQINRPLKAAFAVDIGVLGLIIRP